MEPTHASFFSGVGGLDLGLERAGWRTVSFSEIDPYASAVLAERWPGVPNLGDITAIAETAQQQQRVGSGHACSHGQERSVQWCAATLWSGGFPCQDLSVAGKRAGFAGERSGLAFAFLDLVERHRPPAILLENVPGLLSSHGGRDFGALLGAMGQLGYWWAYRILDARHFGVPQRRRRVFIVGLHAERGFGADSAAAVLSVGTRCGRHPATGHQTGEGVAERAVPGADIVGALDGTFGHHGVAHSAQSASVGHYIAKTVLSRQERNNDDTQQGYVISPSPDPGGVREADGLARRLDDPLALSENQRGELLLTEYAHQLTGGGGKPGQGYPAVLSTTVAMDAGFGSETTDLLPLGLDSHRYRCCGNGVVAPVSEWIGWRLRRAVEGMRAAA